MTQTPERRARAPPRRSSMHGARELTTRCIAWSHFLGLHRGSFSARPSRRCAATASQSGPATSPREAGHFLFQKNLFHIKHNIPQPKSRDVAIPLSSSMETTMNELDEIAPSTQCTNRFRFTALRRETDAAIVLSRDPLVNVEQWISFCVALVPCVLHELLHLAETVSRVFRVMGVNVHRAKCVLSHDARHRTSQTAALVRNHESLDVQRHIQNDKSL